MSAAAPVKDVGAADFEAEVIAASAKQPVVVDFWAAWCGPCRVLGPILEREIAALDGRVVLVKIDTDREPELAGAFAIQGIPAVKAFKDGSVVAEFVGAQPAAFIRQWLAALAPSPAAEALARAEVALRAGQPAQAESALRGMPDAPETRDRASLLLARVLFDLGRGAEARPVLARIDARSDEADAVPAFERLLDFARPADAAADAAARAAIAANPRDWDARWRLAGALAARGEPRAALEELLAIVSRDRKFKDDGARLAMLALFDHLGGEHDLVQEFRRRLQIVL